MEISALTVALSHPEGNIGKLQVVIPYGKFEAPNGALRGFGPWSINNEQGHKLVENIRKDILIDYEHQSILASTNGQASPAAGWARDFEWVDDVGLTANTVEWTNKAANMIREGEYRYLSPVFNQTPDHIPHSLISIALTNTPALQLPSVALTRGTIYMKELLTYLNLPEGSEETDIINHLKSLNQKREADVEVALKTSEQHTVALSSLNGVFKNILSELGLAPTASEMDILASIRKIKEVPAAALQSLQQEVAALKQGEINRERKELIQVALSEGRLLPYLQDWANSININDLKTFIENAKPIAALTSMQSSSIVEPERNPLSDVDEKICTQMRLNRDEFLKMKRGN
jgi:phage I-like protein